MVVCAGVGVCQRLDAVVRYLRAVEIGGCLLDDEDFALSQYLMEL